MSGLAGVPVRPLPVPKMGSCLGVASGVVVTPSRVARGCVRAAVVSAMVVIRRPASVISLGTCGPVVAWVGVRPRTEMAIISSLRDPRPRQCWRDRSLSAAPLRRASWFSLGRVVALPWGVMLRRSIVRLAETGTVRGGAAGLPLSTVPAGGLVFGGGGLAVAKGFAAARDFFFGQFFLFLLVVGLRVLEAVTCSSSDNSSAGSLPPGVCRVLLGLMEMVSVMVGWWLISHSQRSLRSSVKMVMCLSACCATSRQIVLAWSGWNVFSMSSRISSASALSFRFSRLRCSWASPWPPSWRSTKSGRLS